MKKITAIILTLAFTLTMGSSALAENNEASPAFILGPESRENQPTTIDEFIPLFAEQLKRYNEIAREIWPDNAIVDMPFVIDDIDTGRLRHISPEGTIKLLSADEAAEMGVTRYEVAGVHDFIGDFYEYDEDGNIRGYGLEGKKLEGIYFSVSEEELNNIERWGRWPHASSYDVIRFAIHESWHEFEQQKWQAQPVEERINYITKDQFFEVTDARIKRDLLLKQLMAAVSGQGDIDLVLTALATYEDYKMLFPDDYNNSIFWDRIEGTAQYLEYVYSLYVYFPDQIKDEADLMRAFAQLAAHDELRLRTCGVIDEAYEVGAFSGILLDQLGIDWKNRLMDDPTLTALEILSLCYKDETLPEPIEPTQAEIEEALEKLRMRKAEVASILEESIKTYEQMLETAPEEDSEWIVNLIEYYKNRIVELRE